MTALRQSIIAELERVPEDKLHVIMQCFHIQVVKWNLMFFTNDKQLRQEKELPCMTIDDL